MLGKNNFRPYRINITIFIIHCLFTTRSHFLTGTTIATVVAILEAVFILIEILPPVFVEVVCLFIEITKRRTEDQTCTLWNKLQKWTDKETVAWPLKRHNFIFFKRHLNLFFTKCVPRAPQGRAVPNKIIVRAYKEELKMYID